MSKKRMKFIIEHHLLKNTEHKTLYILQKYIQPKYTLSTLEIVSWVGGGGGEERGNGNGV